MQKLPAGKWIASGYESSHAGEWSKQTPGLAAGELQDLEKQDAGAEQAAEKGWFREMDRIRISPEGALPVLILGSLRHPSAALRAGSKVAP
jgi:hypothetical protein